MASKKKTDEPVVRVAPLGELKAYTISEHELELLEQGSPASDLFTVGLCLLSAALTILATLLSTSLPQLNYILFFCSLLIFCISGGICVLVGWRSRRSTKELTKEIRARMPSAPLIQQIIPEPSPSGLQPPAPLVPPNDPSTPS